MTTRTGEPQPALLPSQPSAALPGSSAAAQTSRRSAAVRALRCRQWVKNVLVLGAPLAAGRLADPAVLGGCLVAFALFCAAASSTYLVNDVCDVESDRRHPDKRHRPIASGSLPVRDAVLLSIPLAVGSVVLGFVWSVPLGLTMTTYVAVQLAYNLGLKDQAALDLAAVSSGFLLRAVAGGTAAGIALSPWFLLVAAFGSLFMVAGKRYSEMRRLGPAAATRRSLQMYSESYLRFIWSMAAGVTVVVYILWALTEVHGATAGIPWGPVSVAPFVLGLLRYAADVDRGTAESPEEIVLSDHHLQVIGACWLATLLLDAVTA